jgi:hypothetical protein
MHGPDDGFYEGEPATLGVDIGGFRSATAVVGVTDDLRVCEVHVSTAPWGRPPASSPSPNGGRSRKSRSTRCASRPSPTAGTGAPDRLRPVRSEPRPDDSALGKPSPRDPRGKLTHPGDPELDRHVAAAVANATNRGWRFDKMNDAAQIDAAVALAMACQRVAQRPPPVKLHAWV